MEPVPESRVAPFVDGDGRDGVLLIHGLSGTPHEMRDLALFLRDHGFRVSNVRLAGHAQDERALAASAWPDWWQSVRDAYARLAPQCSRVFVCGLSAGGLLGLKLAATESITAAAIYAAPIFLHHPLLWLLPLARRVLRYGPRRPSDIRDPAALARHPTSGRATLHNIESLRQLGRHVDTVLPQVRCALLLMHGRQDQTVPFANMAHIAGRVGSRDVTLVPLERSGHVVTVDYEEQRVRDTTLAFFRRVIPSSAA